VSSNPFFYADGPPQFWSVVSYVSGLDHGGAPDNCAMTTQNAYSYSGSTSGNSAFWYLPVNPPVRGELQPVGVGPEL